MSLAFVPSSLDASGPFALPLGGDDLAEVFGPVMAGAHARGIADAFDMMGVAAILIDREGHILHCGRYVADRLGSTLSIVGSRLLGADETRQSRIDMLLADAACWVGPEPLEADLGQDGVESLRLVARRLSTTPGTAQIVWAVISIERRVV